MPEIHVTDEQGVEHIFPDGSTPEMIAQVLKVKPPTAAAAPPAQQSGFLESLGHTFGIGTQEAEQRKQDLAQHPIRTIIQDQPAVAAIQGAYQGGKRILGELGQAGSAAMQGNGAAAASHAISAIPLLGPALDTAAAHAQANGMNAPGNSYAQDLGIAATTPGTLGTVAGTAAQVAPMALGALDNAAPNRPTIATPDPISTIKNYLRPPTSPSVVPRTEMAARNLSAAVLPATKDASNFIQAAQKEVPNVLDYAKRTGNPMNTQLEFSKAAAGYAQEVRDLYEKNVLGPVENKLVKTTGTGFGQQMQEGPDLYSTLGEIDKRIVDINKQLDAPTLNSDDARRALASKTALKSEAAGLRDILHKNLSEASGLTPEQVADLRQRVGRSYELANDTNAAVTARQQAAGKTDMGPIHPSQIPSRALEFTRGGAVPIADRAFQRAIAQFPGEAQPLPAVNAPAAPPSAPVDRLTQLLAESRQRQATAQNKFRLSQQTGLPPEQLDKVIQALRGQF